LCSYNGLQEGTVLQDSFKDRAEASDIELHPAVCSLPGRHHVLVLLEHALLLQDADKEPMGRKAALSTSQGFRWWVPTVKFNDQKYDERKRVLRPGLVSDRRKIFGGKNIDDLQLSRLIKAGEGIEDSEVQVA
jgi:hypothetical protein